MHRARHLRPLRRALLVSLVAGATLGAPSASRRAISSRARFLLVTSTHTKTCSGGRMAESRFMKVSQKSDRLCTWHPHKPKGFVTPLSA